MQQEELPRTQAGRRAGAPPDTRHQIRWDPEKEVSPVASPHLITDLTAKKSAHMGPVSPLLILPWGGWEVITKDNGKVRTILPHGGGWGQPGNRR